MENGKADSAESNKDADTMIAVDGEPAIYNDGHTVMIEGLQDSALKPIYKGLPVLLYNFFFFYFSGEEPLVTVMDTQAVMQCATFQ